MKIIFGEAVYNKGISLPEKIIRFLPSRIALFTTIQFIKNINSWKSFLEERKIKVELVRPRHAYAEGHILGCSNVSLPASIKGVLFVGDGSFHPLALAMHNPQKIIVYNPFTKEIREFEREEAVKIMKYQKGAYARFLSSKNVGVLVTTKYGQQRINEALALQRDFKDKNFYYLLFDTLDFSQLENFPFVDCFINTACPRIIDDKDKFLKPVLNIDFIYNKSVF